MCQANICALIYLFIINRVIQICSGITLDSAQWRALCTKITEVNLSEFVYRQFHEDFSLLIRTTHRISSDEWKEIFMKRSVNKFR